MRIGAAALSRRSSSGPARVLIVTAHPDDSESFPRWNALAPGGGRRSPPSGGGHRWRQGLLPIRSGRRPRQAAPAGTAGGGSGVAGGGGTVPVATRAPQFFVDVTSCWERRLTLLEFSFQPMARQPDSSGARLHHSPGPPGRPAHRHGVCRRAPLPAGWLSRVISARSAQPRAACRLAGSNQRT